MTWNVSELLKVHLRDRSMLLWDIL